MKESREPSASSSALGVRATLVGTAFPPVATLATYAIVAQVLGPEDRGFVAAAMAPFLLVSSALTFGLPEALTYFESKGEIRRARTRLLALTVLFAAGLLGTILTFLASDRLSHGNSDLRRSLVLVTMLASPALVCAGLRGIALARQRWKLVAAERILGAIARLAAIALTAAVFGLTSTNAPLILGATLSVSGVLYLRLIWTRSGREEEPLAPEASMRRMHGYGGRAWLGAIAGILLMRLDQLLLTPLSSLEQLGFYVVAVNVAEASLVFNAAVREVMFSRQASKTNHEQLARASRVSTVVTLVLVLASAAACPFAIPLLFGVEFSASLTPALILLVGVLLGNPGSVVGAGLAASGRPELRSYSLLAALTVNVGLLLILAPHYGAVGAAAATLVGNVVSAGLNIAWYCKLNKVPPSKILRIRVSDFRATWETTRLLTARK